MAFRPFTLKTEEASCASTLRRRIHANVRLCLNLPRIKTFNKGSLGSCIDEERSEARNVV